MLNDKLNQKYKVFWRILTFYLNVHQKRRPFPRQRVRSEPGRTWLLPIFISRNLPLHVLLSAFLKLNFFSFISYVNVHNWTLKSYFLLDTISILKVLLKVLKEGVLIHWNCLRTFKKTCSIWLPDSISWENKMKLTKTSLEALK